MENFKVLFSGYEIQKKIEELAIVLDEFYEGKEIVVICVLKGAVFFYSRFS